MSAALYDGLPPSLRGALDDVLDGLSVNAAARRRCLSKNTIKRHRERLFDRLGLHSQVEILATALASERALRAAS